MLLPWLLACANSGLGQTDVGESSDSGASDSSVKNCPWVGDWSLDGIQCGAFDYDGWFDGHDEATLAIAHDPDGGCEVEARVQGAECDRTELWHFGLPDEYAAVSVTFVEIAECDPEGCAFTNDEPTCEVGDVDDEETLTIDASTGDLSALGLLADTAPGCPPELGLTTVWVKE